MHIILIFVGFIIKSYQKKIEIWSPNMNLFPLLCRCSWNTSTKSPEISGYKHGVTNFTNVLVFKLTPQSGPRAKQLRRTLPGVQQQSVILSCSPPNAKNPKLREAEWNLQVQDLPSLQTEQRGPKPARDSPARRLHTHPTLKAGRRRSSTQVW